MNRYEIARYAELLPNEADRDSFAGFAARAPVDHVRQFIRYQLQMRHRGFEPAAYPRHYYGKKRPMDFVKKSEAA